MIRKYAEIFCWKNVSSFCNAKATHIFSAKNIRILYIESAKTVNETTLNEPVKLATLWTTGPWILAGRSCPVWFSFVWDMCAICKALSVISLGWVCSMIVALSTHHLYYILILTITTRYFCCSSDLLLRFLFVCSFTFLPSKHTTS